MAPIKVAVLDLYDGEENQGMRAIRELLTAADGAYYGLPVHFQIYETRLKDDLPSPDHDIYLSSGGPGSPFDGKGKTWERHYFEWLDALWNHNERYPNETTKHALFICHSYQMMCRFFQVARVTKRRSESFGIFPVHKTEAGLIDPLFEPLPDPFYAADFRKWQVVEPDLARLAELGAQVLACEKKRDHIPLERATMAMRISPEIVGVQFHPEADPPGMMKHFADPARRKFIARHHGKEKYERIMYRLGDPMYLKRTHDVFIPTFLRQAIEALRPELAAVETA
jgi:GMP synthase-like glutamine amidotransferase